MRTGNYIKMNKLQYFNYLAVSVLEQMGMTNPEQVEIDILEKVLKKYYQRVNRHYNHRNVDLNKELTSHPFGLTKAN